MDDIILINQYICYPKYIASWKKIQQRIATCVSVNQVMSILHKGPADWIQGCTRIALVAKVFQFPVPYLAPDANHI